MSDPSFDREGLRDWGFDVGEAPARPVEDEAEAMQWAIVEIFGHRRHAGKAGEEERFGGKMLRIDVPELAWSEPTAEAPEPRLIVERWVTHFYGGASIFSFTLTDEATAMRINRPYHMPQRYIAPPDVEDTAADSGDEDDAAAIDADPEAA